MPQRHSKNNNDLAFFTYDEKRKLGYGTQKERLGKDSIKPFDACCLCLKSLIDPMSCQKGHLFCKECILQCLLSQKKDIQRYFLNFSFYNNDYASSRYWLLSMKHVITWFKVWIAIIIFNSLYLLINLFDKLLSCVW